MSADIVVVRKRLAFSAVPDIVLQHPRLSFPARVALGWMLGRPEDWIIKIGHMTYVLGLSEKVWKRVKSELIKEGFFTQTRERGERGKFNWTQEVTDTPLFTTPPPAGMAKAWMPKGGINHRHSAKIKNKKPPTT